MPRIQVRGDVATATTIDSGQVIDRQSGDAKTLYEERFWTLLKREDRWLVTSFVASLGDESSTLDTATNTEVQALLEQEETARENGDQSGLLSLYAEHFSGYDGLDQQTLQVGSSYLAARKSLRNIWPSARLTSPTR